MVIKGFEKTTLVDYPGHIATTVFTGGCNMRCPYCHNRELVLGIVSNIPQKDFFDFIEKRHSVLEAVCITGGEPTLQEELLTFIEKIKSYKLKVKLDTNGLNPTLLKTALSRNLLDYIAMDIKNSIEKYSLTTGIQEDLLPQIIQSIDYIKTSNIDYEFRTTIVKELHAFKDFINIGEWLNGSKAYYLQQYQYSSHQLSDTAFTAYTPGELTAIKEALLPFFGKVEIRNI